jgi:hypothetical protein
MAITYNFTNIQLEVASKIGELENVVTRITYLYNGEDENGFKSSYNGITLMPSPEDNSFKLFNTLTEEDIIDWLNQVINKAQMEEIIEKSIKYQKSPRYIPIGNPWDQNNLEIK